MKVSTRVRYGIRALVEIALRYPHGAVSVREIGESQQISRKYLELIIQPLKAAGLVTAARGMHGGYALARPPETIRLSEVFNIVEGSTALVQCVEHPDQCPMEEFCPTRDTWVQLGEAFAKVLEGTTVQDLIDRKRRKSGSHDVTYQI